MKRKYLGVFFLLVSVLMLAACSGHGNGVADECLEDSTAPGCDDGNTMDDDDISEED